MCLVTEECTTTIPRDLLTLSILHFVDEIYEEAMSTRDTYCSSLMATASALKSALVFQNGISQVVDNVSVVEQQGTDLGTDMMQPPMQQLAPMMQPPTHQSSSPMMQPPMQPLSPMMQPPTQQISPMVQPIPHMMQPPIQEASVMHPNEQTVSQQQQQQQPVHDEVSVQAPSHDLGKTLSVDAPKSAEVKHKEVTKPEKKQVAPPPGEEEGASDVLSTVLGFVFVSIFELIYFLVVKLPFRIAVATLLASIVGAVLSIVWFYVASDNGANELGASLGYGFNRAGIY